MVLFRLSGISIRWGESKPGTGHFLISISLKTDSWPVCRIAQPGCWQSAIVPHAKHVPLKRLLVVASADNQIFTQGEFNHLKECTECFVTWSEFIHQLMHWANDDALKLATTLRSALDNTNSAKLD
jgi:hypothetical protein